MNRVVITGIGAVTPLGNTFPDSWKCIKEGISGIAPLSKFPLAGMPWITAGEVRGFRPEQFFTKKELLHLDPFILYAVAAATMAAEDAGVFEQTDSLAECGVIIGSSRGGVRTLERAIKENRRTGRTSPFLMPSTTISMAASYTAQKLGMKGTCLGISNACASGANAIGEAFRMIRSGVSQMMLAGGTEAPLSAICIEGYGSAGALSKEPSSLASRPFDKERDGFVLAEGACVLVLEEYAAAVERNATLYGEIMGYSATTDAFHITRPSLHGETHALQSALHNAGIIAEDIDYINTHGTSTPLGDKTEAEALTMVFGKRAAEIPASALKSMTGHMLAASGAFEAACTAMSLYEGIIPPTINLHDPDPACALNILTKPFFADMQIGLSNSFGFGGVNAVLVLKKTGS